MKKVLQIDAVRDMVPDGATVMIGGFMGVGSPHRIIDQLVEQGVRDLTIIANDTAMPGKGIGKLISCGAVSRAIVSHIGLNPETQKQMIDGRLAVELVPQGTLVERIRSAGVGLGGVLTATGLGTVVEEGKQVIEIDGKPYLVELPLFADVALVAAKHADYVGNLEYSLTAQNFNPVMAMAARLVIAEPQHVLPVGAITPDNVGTPGVLIDYLIGRSKA